MGSDGQPMKILFLAWNFPPARGGIEYVAWHLVSGLKACGDEVRVIARHDPNGAGDPAVARPSRPGLVAYLLFALRRSRELLRDFRADVIVCPGIVTAPVAWWVAKRHATPVVVLAHGSDVTHGGCAYRAAMRFFFRAAAGVAANSRSTKELMAAAGCRLAMLRVIHPGVNTADYPPMDPARREAIRAAHGLAGRKVLFSVGRLIRRKGGLDFVEQVMPGLVKAVPEVVLVVVGGDATDSLVHHEGMLAQIQRQVAQRGLEKHVRLLGSVEDATVQELHYAADIHLLPALQMKNDVEGFGIVLLEAALAEVPVVATRVGGIPEAMADGETGLLAEPGDWAGLAHQIQTLLNDDALRQRMGRRGRECALAHFGWPTIVGQYRDFFRAVMANRGASI